MKPVGPVGRVVRLPLQRAWWWFLRLLYPPRLAGRGALHIHVMDARAPRARVAAPYNNLVQDALERLSTAGQGFGELVTDHIQLVAFMDVEIDFALPYLKTYVTPLKPAARPSSHLLACQLVWAATVLRLSRNRLQFPHGTGDSEVSRAAQAAQLRFVQQFPNWEEWARALQLPTPE